MSSSPLLEDWATILGQEWNHCDDDDYARRLYEACWPTKPAAIKTSRPYAHMVELALYSACHYHPGAKFVWQKHLAYLEKAKRKTTLTSQLIDNLQDWRWLKRFAARHVLLHLGGQAIEPLQILSKTNQALKPTAAWLIDSICEETTARLQMAANQWLCPDCLVHCGPHYVDKPLEFDPAYYGCRYCRRSHGLLTCSAGVAAVLDHNWQKRYHQQADGQIRGNVFAQQTLFDFSWVEIICASDEAVERFAMQAGNDTDPHRQPPYQTIPCYIAHGCQLSANTLRILENIFAHVETT